MWCCLIQQFPPHKTYRCGYSNLDEESAGKPCCGCKVKKNWKFTRVCDSTPTKLLMETCAGERGTSCDGRRTMSDGEYSCWTKTSGCAAPETLPWRTFNWKESVAARPPTVAKLLLQCQLWDQQFKKLWSSFFVWLTMSWLLPDSTTVLGVLDCILVIAIALPHRF